MKIKKRAVARSGFTLIELLTVIALIAILSAMLLPTFSRAREAARRTSCLSNMRQIGMAFQQYTDDHDERLPGMFSEDCSVYGVYGVYQPGSRNWALAILPYLKSTQVYVCPSDTDRAGMVNRTSRLLLLDAAWPGVTATSSNEEIARAFPLSYATNLHLSQRTDDRVGSGVGVEPGGRSMVALKTPSKLFLLAEFGAAKAGSLDEPGNFGDWAGEIPPFVPPDFWQSWPRGQRHLGGRNFAFCDGHVKFYPDPPTLTASSNMRDDIYPARGVFTYPTMEG